jgi:hypothetical protein
MSENSRQGESHTDSIVRQEEEAWVCPKRPSLLPRRTHLQSGIPDRSTYVGRLCEHSRRVVDLALVTKASSTDAIPILFDSFAKAI